MDLARINEIAYRLMGNRKAHNEREIGGVYYHGQRVANIALELRKCILPDNSSFDDVISSACYMHDCGKGIEPHDRYGAIIAQEALKDIINQDELTTICKIIENHDMRCPENNNYADYIKIVQDADMIDHFGTYEIWMSINYNVHTNGSIHDMIDYYKKNHEKHINKHRKLLNYDISKQIFDDRVAFKKTYIERILVEDNGGIYKGK